MSTVTPTVAIVVFVIILVISLLIAFNTKTFKDFDTSRVHIFIIALGGLGVIITFLFYYSVVELQQQDQQRSYLKETSRVSNQFTTKLLTNIRDASSIVPGFVATITPLQNKGITPQPDPNTPQVIATRFTLSTQIFSVWQDVIYSKAFLNISQLAFVTNFLQMANSSQLYAEWQNAKINLSDRTQLYGDLLFKYGLPITVQTPEEYVRVATELVNSSEFAHIVH